MIPATTTTPGTTTPATTPPATTAATPQKTKKENPSPLTRITKLTQTTLLKAAAVVYQRHTQAEIIEIALEALLGHPQPIIHCALYDPARQLENAAKLAEIQEFITDKARAITRARLGDKGDQAAACEAIKDLRISVEELRSQIKEIAADAQQAKIIINAAGQHLAGATAAAERIQRLANATEGALAQAKSKNETKVVEEQTARLTASKAEYRAVTSLIKILRKTEETQP